MLARDPVRSNSKVCVNPRRKRYFTQALLASPET